MKERSREDLERVALVSVVALGAFAIGVAQHFKHRDQERVSSAHIKSLEKQNEDLAYKASHDELTGLLNKPAWKEEIVRKMGLGKAFGIFFIDVDHFKDINDKCGHEFGDTLLRMGSQVLSSNFRRKGDIITHERLFSNGTDGQPEGSTGRLGGDEFGVIVSLKAENGDRPQDPEEQMANTLSYLTCLLDEFSDDMNSTTIIPKFGFSIGSAIWYPEHPVDPSTLVHMADTAMYKNKDEHRA